jgi:hypothetical protein
MPAGPQELAALVERWQSVVRVLELSASQRDDCLVLAELLNAWVVSCWPGGM